MCYLSTCVFPLFGLLVFGNSSSIHTYTAACRAHHVTSKQRGFGGLSIAVQTQKNKHWTVLCMSSLRTCFLLFVAGLCCAFIATFCPFQAVLHFERQLLHCFWCCWRRRTAARLEEQEGLARARDHYSNQLLLKAFSLWKQKTQARETE